LKRDTVPEHSTPNSLLVVNQLTRRFGGTLAVDNVTLSIEAGETIGVIGPNGAGKSTLIGLLGGAIRPNSGAIYFCGRDVTKATASERARLGIGRTYQIPRPFLDMTVEENLLAAFFSIHPWFRWQHARERVHEILEGTGLKDAADQPARLLPLLRRKRLELARALALTPRVLLLDEVGAGLVDAEIGELIEVIQQIKKYVDIIIVVEHVIRLVRQCCQNVAVLNFGSLIAVGQTREVLASDDVAAIYLGHKHAKAGSGRSGVSKGDASFGPPDKPERTEVRKLIELVNATEAGEKGPINAALIELKGVSAGYGQARVLTGISLRVNRGETIAVIGTNGAGKTTLAGVLSGLVVPTLGHLFIDGQEVTGASPHQIAKRGLSQCLEGRRIFSALSVEENLLVAARGIGSRKQTERLAIIYELFPPLAERKNINGTLLSGGEQQMLAIGRALMARPRAVVFDEISLGLAPVMIDRLYVALGLLRKAGLTMIIVEQDVDRALDMADKIYVLERGEIALSGQASDLKSDSRLRAIYMGETE
jgi:branched-chain amino acid transport system ATP-binding protein